MIAWLAMSALATETVLVAPGATWRYLDSGIDPGATWTDPGFDDTAWAQGPAPLGYGIAPLGTTVAYGPDPLDRHMTTWFRTTVSVPDPSLFETFSVHLRRDDGAVVYVNGVEVGRSNLPDGTVLSETAAVDSLYGPEQDVFVDLVVPPGLVVAGDNVVAVEVHQQAPSSPDLVFDLELSGWDGPTTVTRGPYLQLGTPDGAVVRWRTDGPSEGHLWWGSTVGVHAQTAIDPVVGFDHELAITGAAPDTLVYYAVGAPGNLVLAGDDADHVFRTSPAPGTRRPIRVWVLGDSGTADVNAEAVRDAYATAYAPLDTDVWLMLGDNAYNSGTELEFQAAVFDTYPELLRQVPLWSAIGNHEGYSAFSSTQSGPYFDLFTFPTAGEAGGIPSGTEAFYSFDYGNIHFVSLDSYHSDRSPTGAMLTWLQADLAATTADWVIAIFHHPPYSKGSHDSDRELGMVEMREHALPVLEAGGVDLVLTGHSHSYERSYLLDGHYGDSSTLDRAMIRQDHSGDPAVDGAYTKWAPGIAPNEGAVYVVAGSSGKISGGALDHPAMVTSLNVLGSVILEVDGLSLEARFLDDLGAVRDTWVLDKGVTTIVQMDGPEAVAPGETVDLHGLAFQPDGTEPPDYEWDPGDGSPALQGADVQHAYTGADRLVVATLTVTGDGGEQASDTLDIHVDAGPPALTYVGPTATDEGALTTFTATASDPAGDVLTYEWAIEGVTYTGDVAGHTFWEDGTYPVTLTVTDDAGRTVEQVLDVQVANLPPEVATIAGSDLVEGRLATLEVDTTDPGLLDELVSASWDLGGGVVQDGEIVTHTFPDSGRHQIVVTLTDEDGGVGVWPVDVDIANDDPTLDEVTWDGGGVEGADVGFRATASDPGASDVVAFSWDFGDGTQPQAGADVVHRFPDQGPFTVTVTADDGEGGLGIADVQVTLANQAPEIRTISVPSRGTEGEALLWAVVAEDPGTGDVLTTTWTMGDGTVLVGDSVVHTHADDGVYLVQASVEDDEGAGADLLVQIPIDNVAPYFASAPLDLVALPSQRWRWPIAVVDPGDDELSFELEGPIGAFVEDGEVFWTPRSQDDGTIGHFTLTVTDDSGEGSTIDWAVVVDASATGGAPGERLGREDVHGCGCAQGGPSGGWLLLLMAAGARISPRRGRPGHQRAPGRRTGGA